MMQQNKARYCFGGYCRGLVELTEGQHSCEACKLANIKVCRNRAYYALNAERERRRCKRWRQAHPDRAARAWAALDAPGRDRERKRHNAWYHANKALISARRKAKRQRNPEKHKAIRRAYYLKAKAEKEKVAA